MPVGELVRSEVDMVIRHIETLASSDEPPEPRAGLSSLHSHTRPPRAADPRFLGEWKLAYASNGHFNQTSLLASLLHVADAIPGLGIGGITQRIFVPPASAASMEGIQLVENTTTLGLGMSN